MAKYLISTALTETVRLRSGTTGETFTISNATTPTGASWGGPTISEVGSGAYSLTFTPSVVGVYLATVTGNTSGEVFSGAWEIVAVPAPAFSRQANGEVIASADINELQVALEKTMQLLGLT